ncbi:MAG TPA: CoA-binding protein [Nitriliruptorales bacterium]|nr:CoA-binding protein [Nitriliruptorales bacterium]
MTVRDEDAVRRVLRYTRRIAVVGLSAKPHRASHGVAAALVVQGYEVVPVNPHVDQVLGRRAYPSLRDVPGNIDLVDVFRRPEHLPDVAREAAAVGARGLWLQLGLRSEEARRVAEEAGMDIVEDRCLKVEVARLEHEMELPPPAA